MTGGELRVNGGVSNANGQQFEWGNASVNTAASPNTAVISVGFGFDQMLARTLILQWQTALRRQTY